MTITLQAVNELIASLESAGELSIREQKFLKLAKAFKQLAAENVALKLKGRELLNEASTVYQKYNATTDFYSGDFMDGLLDVNYLGRYASTTLAAFELFLS